MSILGALGFEFPEEDPAKKAAKSIQNYEVTPEGTYVPKETSKPEDLDAAFLKAKANLAKAFPGAFAPVGHVKKINPDGTAEVVIGGQSFTAAAGPGYFKPPGYAELVGRGAPGGRSPDPEIRAIGDRYVAELLKLARPRSTPPSTS